MSKSKNSKSVHDDIYRQFLQDGINELLYDLLYKGESNSKCSAETFSNIYCTLLYDGVHQLSKMITEEHNKHFFYKQDILMKLNSLLSFYAIFKLVNRGNTFRRLQFTALVSQFDLGQSVITKDKLKAFWERLSNLTINYCTDAGVDVLKVQKQVRVSFSNLLLLFVALYVVLVNFE